MIHGFTGINGMGVNVGLISIIASITSSILPNDRRFDAMDLSTRLLGGSPSPRQEWFFYGQPGNLWATRVGNHKLVFESWESVGSRRTRVTRLRTSSVATPLLLFDLSTDVAERHNIADQQPDIVAQIQKSIAQHQQSLADDCPATRHLNSTLPCANTS